MFTRFSVLLAAAVATIAFVPAALAVRVHVRVEGKTRTIFGPTAPLLDVTSPRANPLPENALDALETASAIGEFYVHVKQFSFGPFVDQIGLYPAVGNNGWVFKVDGVAPQVGADKVTLKAGDSVLWYWATFSESGAGPPTLVLTHLRGTPCYRVQAQDDKGNLSAAIGAVLHVGKRTYATQGATGAVMRCIPSHRGLLVRATMNGAVRSNALP